MNVVDLVLQFLASNEALLASASFLACTSLLAGWLHFGLGRRLIAVPNARSSHDSPTPTGGGVAIVLVMVGVLAGYFFLGVTWAGWLAVGGLSVASIGLLDDLYELSAVARLALQILVISLLLWSGDLLGLSQVGWMADLPMGLIAFLWVGALVWFLNLFNFMDGIDGLATSQSGSYCLAALLFMTGDAGWYAGVLWAGFACSVGFAVFNMAPARIFMGDAGSSFWGLLLGVLAMQLAVIGALPLIASLILLSAFWFDATYTLIVRMATGQRFTQGHRSHLYQRLADRLGHRRTTACYLAFFLLWQWPLTYAFRAIYLSNDLVSPGAGLQLEGWWLVVLACLPLAAGCVFLKAGRIDKRSEPVTGW